MDDHRARCRQALRACLLVLPLSLLVASCGPSVPNTGAKVRPLAGLLVICDPQDAMIYVDDKYMGSVKGLGRRPLMLSDGVHRVEVRRDGYFAHFTEVTVAKGVRQQLKLKLRKEPF